MLGRTDRAVGPCNAPLLPARDAGLSELGVRAGMTRREPAFSARNGHQGWCAHRVHGWSGSRPPGVDSASYDELGDPHAYRGLRPEEDTAWVLVFEATSLQLSHEM
jgi:hypothetical protein